MIGRRSVICLSLLSAILFSAFAAQSVSALVVTKSKNTTAFTCVFNGKGEFADAHCDEKGGLGSFAHVAISNGQTTTFAATNEKVTSSTVGSEPAVIKGTIGLAKVSIECSKVRTSLISWIRNVEPAAGQHTLEGTVEPELSECNVKELNKCIVQDPILLKATIHGVEGMEGPKGEKNAMGVEFVGHGIEETFGNILFTNKGAEACSLNGKSFPMKGRVVATNGPTTESAQEGKGTGATLVFTPKFKMQTLKLGPNAATFETNVTASMFAGNPIALTTGT